MCRSAGGIGESLVPKCLTEVERYKGGYCVSYCNAPSEGFWASDVLARSNCPIADGVRLSTVTRSACNSARNSCGV